MVAERIGGDMKLCMGCMEEIEEDVSVCPYCGYDESTQVQESYYLKPGTVIGGKYIVGKVLKYRGYIVKYIGMDGENQQRVIIGEYLPSDFSTRSEGEKEVTIYSGDALEQFQQGLITFLNEGNRMQQLGEVPGIARVYDCIAENETGYVISEYLEGSTLQEALDSGKTYTANEAGEMICCILQGLSRVHPQDVVHCDIAPENIMLLRDGQVKLLDFGAARYVTTANSRSLAIILKQGYAPEEQYRSQGQRGPWTDVYALGAVMYRMITGKVPAESVERALADDLEEPSKLGVEIAPSMENALMNALNIYQKDRTPSAEKFYQELTSGDTRRIKVKQRKKETGKLPVWAKGLVALVVLALIAGGTVLYHQSSQNSKKKMVAQKEQKFSTGEGKSYASFQKTWKAYGFDINHVEKEYCYDTTVKEDMVKEFEDCTGGKLTEGASVPKNEPSSKKGKSIAKIVIASRDKVTFQREWQNYYYKPRETEIFYDSKSCPTEPEKGKDNRPYGTLELVSYDGKTYAPSNIGDLPNPLDTDKLKVRIYTGAFYSMPANSRKEDYYQGKQVKDILFCYGKQEGGKPDRTLDAKLYEKNYISFSNKWEEGSIVEVLPSSLKAGKKFSGREEPGTVFDVVGRKQPLGQITVAELERVCNEWKIRLDKNGHGSQEIVSQVDRKVCKKGGKLKITMAVSPTPKPTPTPDITQKPAVVKTPKPTATPKSKSKPNYHNDNVMS